MRNPRKKSLPWPTGTQPITPGHVFRSGLENLWDNKKSPQKKVSTDQVSKMSFYEWHVDGKHFDVSKKKNVKIKSLRGQKNESKQSSWWILSTQICLQKKSFRCLHSSKFKTHLPFFRWPLLPFLHFPSHPPQTTIPHLGWHEAGTAPTRWYLENLRNRKSQRRHQQSLWKNGWKYQWTKRNSNKKHRICIKTWKNIKFFWGVGSTLPNHWDFLGGIYKFLFISTQRHLLLQPCQRCCAARYRHRKTVLHEIWRFVV